MYPTAVRRVLVGLGAVMAGLVALSWHHRGGRAADHWVAARLTAVGHWTVTGWLGRLTDPWYVVAMAAVLAVVHEQMGQRRRAWAVVVPVLGALAVTELVLKPGVDARGLSGVWTFPSGNVAGGVALVVTLWWVEVRPRRRSPWKTAALTALAVVVTLSSLALVAGRVHYLTDAAGGVCVGVGVPLAILGVSRRTPRRRLPARRLSTPGSGPGPGPDGPRPPPGG